MSSRTRLPPPRADVVASDLVVEIVPREAVEWLGTRAQLEAESLVPPEILWPDRDRWTGWTQGPFEFWLRRTRPHGMKGPKRLWIDGDFWALRQTLLADRGKGHLPAVIHEKRRELEMLLWRQSEQGQEYAERWRKAAADAEFQAFKDYVMFG